MADHTFLVCSSQGSRRRVFKSSSKSSFAASAANAVYDSVGHWGPLSCLIVCLLTFSSAQSAVYKSLFGTSLFVSLRQHFLCLSVVIVDCTHLYLASELGAFYGGHARRDVFLYPYCLLLCINIVTMDCTHLYLASALGVFYAGHVRRDVFLYLYCLLLCISIVIMDCTHLYHASALGVFYGGNARCDVHPCYPGDRQTVFSFLFFSCHCNVVYCALLNLI